jgi:hypothetical protein
MADQGETSGGDGARRAFGELEGDVLAILWAARSPMTPAEIDGARWRPRLHDRRNDPDPLNDKGLVERERGSHPRLLADGGRSRRGEHRLPFDPAQP